MMMMMVAKNLKDEKTCVMHMSYVAVGHFLSDLRRKYTYTLITYTYFYVL